MTFEVQPKGVATSFDSKSTASIIKASFLTKYIFLTQNTNSDFVATLLVLLVTKESTKLKDSKVPKGSFKERNYEGFHKTRTGA